MKLPLVTPLLGLCSISLLAAPLEPPAHWSIAAPPTHSLRSGATVSLTLTGLIDPTWHVYALDEPDGGPVPTEIGLTGSSPIQLLSVDQATPKTVADSFYRKRTAFFEHQADFTLHLKLPATPLPRSTILGVSVRYQACNDKACLAPRTVVVELPLASSLR